MDATELAANDAAAEWMVHDLNLDPTLPFADASFDAVTCCVSVDYLTRPLEVFAEVAHVLRPGGSFVSTFSNRCFPTKAIRGWRSTNAPLHQVRAKPLRSGLRARGPQRMGAGGGVEQRLGVELGHGQVDVLVEPLAHNAKRAGGGQRPQPACVVHGTGSATTSPVGEQWAVRFPRCCALVVDDPAGREGGRRW